MNVTPKKIICLAGALSSCLGIIAGLFMMYVAWDHNPQCEIHCDGVINWNYWISIGISWFIAIGIVLFLSFGIIPYVFLKLRRRKA